MIKLRFAKFAFGKKKTGKKKKILFAVLILAIFGGGFGYIGAKNGWFGGGAGVPEDTFSRGLVGYWNFDEGGGDTAYDASGNGYNCTLGSSSAPDSSDPSWTKGVSGGALKFGGYFGGGEYLNCGNSLPAFGTNNFSVEFLVKMENFEGSGSYFPNVIGRGTTGGGNWMLRFTSATNFAPYIDQAFMAGNVNTFLNNWHHIIYTRSGNDFIAYIDGKYSSTTNQALNLSSVDNLYIGSGNLGANRYFNGVLDDVRIYNRSLSEAEVKYHYNHGGPVGYWKFDEGSGIVAKDSTDSNNDGTVTGATWTDGKYGSALSFDGNDDYVVTSPFALSGNALTYNFWATSSRVNRYQSFISDYYQSGVHGYIFLYREYGNDNLVYQYAEGASYTASIASNFFSGFDNQLIFISVVADYANKRIDYYRNGVLFYTDTNISAMMFPVTNNAKYFGAYSPTMHRLGGKMDDIKIYNYARTADEIRLDYQAGMAIHLGPNGKTCSEDPASCMNQGMVGYWDMEEGSGNLANDRSGNGNNGTLTNGPKWTTGAPMGGGKGALQFDGKDDHIICTNSLSLNSVSNQATWEAWIKISRFSNQSDNHNEIMMRSWNNWRLFVNQSGHRFGLVQIINGQNKTITSDTVFLANIWYHVVATYDGASLKLFVNGKSDAAPVSASGSLDATNSDLTIGKYGSTSLMNGYIDDIRIYNRALSAEEVRYHYNQGGPVGYWKLDEGSGVNAKDSTGNNNDGTISGAVWANGKYGSALQFNGGTEYVNAGNPSSMQITGNMTVSAWVKTSEIPPTARRIASKDDVVTNRSWAVQVESNGAVTYYIWRGNNILNSGSSRVIADGQWHYVACVNDGTNMAVYVDGIKDSSSANGGSIDNDPASVYIGATSQGNQSLNGIIDDVKIYNYARSESEIRQDYQAGTATHLGPSGKSCGEDPASCMSQDLVGYWPFDESGGVTAYDKSGRAYNIALNNGATWGSGKYGSALSLDGKDDYAGGTFGTGPQFNDNVTLEAWFYPKDINKTQIIATKWHYQELDFEVDGGKLLGVITTNNGSQDHWYTGSGGSILPDQWNHGLIEYNSAWGHAKLFLNGIQVATINTDGYPLRQPSTSAWFGAYYYTPSKNFKGYIDEARLYKRILSEEEIRYHYNQGTPVAHWKFDEGRGATAFDESANNNDGTISGATWVEGKYGSALNFDGGDYVSVNNSPSLSVSNGVTVGAWVYLNADQTWRGIVEKGPMGGVLGDYILSIANTNKPIFRLNASAGSTGEGTALTAGVWNYIVGTYDRNNLKLYINGILDKKSASYTAAINQSTGNVNIGIYFDTGYKLNGKVDDVRIYNYARTADEIRLDYQAGVATHLK